VERASPFLHSAGKFLVLKTFAGNFTSSIRVDDQSIQLQDLIMSTQTTASEKIVHESEIHRHHIRIALPASAVVNGNTYKVSDLSSGGFSINSKDTFPLEPLNVKLLFAFDSFSFHLDVNARLVYKDKDKAGFSFAALNARKISLLNYIIKSYLSGLIITEGDIINVASRNDFSKLREKPKSNDNTFKKGWTKIVPVGALFLIGFTGLFLLFSNIYETAVIIKSPFGIVESETYTARAETNGIFHSLLAQGTRKVIKDQPLGVIKANSSLPDDAAGNYILKSPCDCIIAQQQAKEGEFRALGEPLFELTPLSARPWVIANLTPDQMYRLKLQDSAYVRIIGESKFVEGNITEFLPPSFNKDFVQVKVKTKEPLPLEAVSRQAYVEFSVY
jgi:mannuronan synthase